MSPPLIQPVLSPIKVGHIEDVQELRKSKPAVIPDRFVRNINERPTPANVIVSSSPQLPVIDFSNLTNPTHFPKEILKLAHACQQWGFFQVVNHDVDLMLMESIEKVGMDFFGLPLEEKQKYPMTPGTVQGYGQAFVFSEDQKLDWCNMFALALEPRFIRNHNLWPNKPTRFGEVVEAYSREVRKLCESLIKYIAVSLGLKGSRLDEIFGGPAVQAIRMNYYPACPRPDLVLGLSPHSDGSALTVLQQAKLGNTVGLQILKDRNWVPIHPLPNAFVINIGDTIEVLTNGRYKSVEHRAVTHNLRDRLSIVTFYAPSYEVELGPLEELVDDNNPSNYRKYNHGEYSKHYITNKLQGKKTLEFTNIIPTLSSIPISNSPI